MRVFLLLLLAVSLPSIANELSVLSPDKKVKLSFTDDGELAQYRVSFNGEPVLGLGKLGFTFAKAKTQLIWKMENQPIEEVKNFNYLVRLKK